MGSSVILPSPGQPVTGPDPHFTTGAIPNLVQFKFQHVDPPAGVYVQRDDLLVIDVASLAGADSVTVFVRLLLPFAQQAGQPDAPPKDGVAGGPIVGPGYIQTLQFVSAPAVGGGATVSGFVLTEGYLLSITAVATLATRRGQTFARVWLQRGAASATPSSSGLLLLADYVTQNSVAGWPLGRALNPTEGPGIMVLTQPANPAAGADFTMTTGATGRARLAGAKATLVTSATAGNRFPSFTVQDRSTNVVHYQVQDTTAVPANTTITYSLAPGGTNVRGGGAPIFETLPLPSPDYALSGVVVNSSTQGLLAGDQWSALVLYTEQWLELI